MSISSLPGLAGHVFCKFADVRELVGSDKGVAPRARRLDTPPRRFPKLQQLFGDVSREAGGRLPHEEHMSLAGDASGSIPLAQKPLEDYFDPDDLNDVGPFMPQVAIGHLDPTRNSAFPC